MLKSAVIVAALILVSPILLAQQPKSSPANDALVAAAKESTAEHKALDNILQQAKSTLDMSQKSIMDELTKSQKDLNEHIRADKKYSGELAHIDTLQKQLQTASSDAQTKFQQSAGPIQQKIATDDALIKGLVPIVRKENEMPDSATFDAATQTWSTAPASSAMKSPTDMKK